MQIANLKIVSKELLILVLLLLFTYPAVKSLLVPGGFTTHDMTHHVVRQVDIGKLLSQGQFPPRWSGDLAYGYGYPIFMFYYPLPALIGHIFHLTGFNFLDSVKAVLFFSFIASTIGMYLFLRSLFKSSLAAFLGAMFYLYNPIHLIVVYVSGSPGASLGLVFPPFICWAITKLWQKQSIKFLLLGSFSFAGLILSHNITAFVFMPVILIFILTLKLQKIPKENPKFLLNILFMFLLGLGLSAWFWIPAVIEKQFIRYDQLMKGFYDNQFPTLKQIIYSPWGYGLSHPKSPEGGMSYMVGIIHLGVMIVLIPLLWVYRKQRLFLVIGIFTIVSFITTIFFMLEISKPLWDILPFLGYVQAPVRLLIVPTFVASIIAALFIKYLPFKKVLFIILLFLVFYANRNHLGVNQKFDPGEQFYKVLALKSTTTSFDEHLPIWVTKMKADQGHGKFTFLSGGGNIKIKEEKSARVLAEIEATSSSRVRFNQYYFPGWQIKVDGTQANFDYLTGNNSGLPVFDIDQGKHQILAEFKNTTIRNIADEVGLFSLGVWLLLFLWYIKKALCK